MYVDGPVIQEKCKTWKNRQDERYNTTIRILDKVNQGCLLDEIIDSEREIPSVSSHSQILSKLAKKYGTLIVTVDKECDTEMAQFACNNQRVLAIMADDSDFLIFPGKWRYFSLRELNMETLDTKEFSRTAIRDYLQLNDKEMVLLSTLNGNDLIPYDDTFHFRRYLLDRQYNNASLRFPVIADFIKETGILYSNNLYKDVAHEIYGRNWRSFVDRVRDSFELYNVVSMCYYRFLISG